MAELSQYAARRLALAKSSSFGRPVTAYLTHARIIARAGVGVVHDHVKAEISGRFSDGHRVRTSDVMRTERVGEFWVLHTRSGSLYVIVTFDRQGGRLSLDTFNAFNQADLHPTHHRLH
jgi:hypothetical protein